MFGRKKRHADQEEAPQAPALPTLEDDDPIWEQPGPRNAGEVDTSDGYVDMGSILFPAVPGMQLRTQLADDGSTVLQILVVLGNSGVQMSVAAAPRSGGVWDEVREEIRSGFASQGASVTDVESRYGDELLVDMPMRMPDGRSGTSRMRIIGREGDRWFARIDLLGPAAASPEAGAHIEKVIDRIVVRRDKHPRTRLELLPLHVPGGAAGVKRA